MLDMSPKARTVCQFRRNWQARRFWQNRHTWLIGKHYAQRDSKVSEWLGKFESVKTLELWVFTRICGFMAENSV